MLIECWGISQFNTFVSVVMGLDVRLWFDSITTQEVSRSGNGRLTNRLYITEAAAVILYAAEHQLSVYGISHQASSQDQRTTCCVYLLFCNQHLDKLNYTRRASFHYFPCLIVVLSQLQNNRGGTSNISRPRGVAIILRTLCPWGDQERAEQVFGITFGVHRLEVCQDSFRKRWEGGWLCTNGHPQALQVALS